MSRLSIDSLERVRLDEWERPKDRGALWMIGDNGAERLTRRYDRGSQMLGVVMVAGLVAVLAFSLGVVHGRVTPTLQVPVARVSQ